MTDLIQKALNDLAITAAEVGDFSAFDAAMDLGASPLAQDRFDCPLIIVAAKNATPENQGMGIVLSLIQDRKVDKNTVDQQGNTLAFVAARESKLDLFLHLKELEANATTTTIVEGVGVTKNILEKNVIHSDISGSVRTYLRRQIGQNTVPRENEALNAAIKRVSERYR